MFTNRFFMLLVAVALVGIAALTLQEAAAISTISSDVSETHRMQQSRAADAARWKAMSDYYERLSEVQQLARSRAADAARWEAMEKYYRQLGDAVSLNLERSRAADAARWTAMAEYYEQRLFAGR